MEYLGLERVSAGEEFGIERLSIKATSLGVGFNFEYQYQTVADYMIDTVVSTTGYPFLSSQDGITRGVINISENYRTIAVASIFGAYADGEDGNTKANLMSTYLDFLLERIPFLFPPQNIVVNLENGVLTWEAPVFSDVNGVLESYNIYLNDELFADNVFGTAYLLNNLELGESYVVGVEAVYEDGISEIVTLNFNFIGVSADEDFEPLVKLHGNYPNPFNLSVAGRRSTTTIKFSTLESSENTEMVVYNIKGEFVKTLVNKKLSGGQHEIVWDGTDLTGKIVSSGIYFYNIKSGKFSFTKKMMIMK